MTGLVIFAHGSTIETANDAVHAVTSELARRTGRHSETAFLDCAPPTMADAVSKLAAAGADRIIVLPYFLTLGIHLQRDLPAIINRLRPLYPSLQFEIAEPLDGHPALLDILTDRYMYHDNEAGGLKSEGKID